MHDMIRKGRAAQLKGEKSPAAKLSADQVARIREQFATGRFRKDIAAEFGIDPTTVSRIGAGGSWRHLPGGVGRRNVPKLTADQVSEVRRMRGEGHSYAAIGKAFGVAAMTIVRTFQRHEIRGDS